MDYSSKLFLSLVVTLCGIVISSGTSISASQTSKAPSQRELTSYLTSHPYPHDDDDKDHSKDYSKITSITITPANGNKMNNGDDDKFSTTTTTSTTTTPQATATTTTNIKSTTTATTTIKDDNNNDDDSNNNDNHHHQNSNNNTNEASNITHRHQYRQKHSNVVVEILLAALFSMIIVFSNPLEVCGIVIGVFLLAVLVLALCVFLRRNSVFRTYNVPPVKNNEPEPETEVEPEAEPAIAQQSNNNPHHNFPHLQRAVTLPRHSGNQYERLELSSVSCPPPYEEPRARSLDDLDLPPPPSLEFPPPPPFVARSSEFSYIELCGVPAQGVDHREVLPTIVY